MATVNCIPPPTHSGLGHADVPSSRGEERRRREKKRCRFTSRPVSRLSHDCYCSSVFRNRPQRRACQMFTVLASSLVCVRQMSLAVIVLREGWWLQRVACCDVMCCGWLLLKAGIKPTCCTQLQLAHNSPLDWSFLLFCVRSQEKKSRSACKLNSVEENHILCHDVVGK